jgi:hypothetical protein
MVKDVSVKTIELVQLTFNIGLLHIDDADVLYKMADNLGIGKFYIYKEIRIWLGLQ